MTVPYVLDLRRGETPKRLHAKAAQVALKKIARDHLGEPLGKRFKGGPETQPGGAFGFVRRAKDYDDRKERVRKHKIPLRGFTDELRNKLRTTARVTGTQHRAVIRLRSPHPLKKEQWREITNVTVGESRRYTGQGNHYYALALAGFRARQARAKRIT